MNQQHRPNPAETYEQYFGPTIADPWTRVLLVYATPQPGERALDVACGTGSVARHVAPMVGAAGKVVAFDISPAMLAVARALPAPAGATIAWLEGNAISLNLPDDAFALVLCQQGEGVSKLLIWYPLLRTSAASFVGGDHDYPSAALSILSRDRYRETWYVT